MSLDPPNLLKESKKYMVSKNPKLYLKLSPHKSKTPYYLSTLPHNHIQGSKVVCYLTRKGLSLECQNGWFCSPLEAKELAERFGFKVVEE